MEKRTILCTYRQTLRLLYNKDCKIKCCNKYSPKQRMIDYMVLQIITNLGDPSLAAKDSRRVSH